jgi:hypothetical protein
VFIGRATECEEVCFVLGIGCSWKFGVMASLGKKVNKGAVVGSSKQRGCLAWIHPSNHSLTWSQHTNHIRNHKLNTRRLPSRISNHRYDVSSESAIYVVNFLCYCAKSRCTVKYLRSSAYEGWKDGLTVSAAALESMAQLKRDQATKQE